MNRQDSLADIYLRLKTGACYSIQLHIHSILSSEIGLMHRQLYIEFCADMPLPYSPDAPVMSLHDLLAKRKAQTRPFVLILGMKAGKGVEDLICILIFKTDPIVPHNDLY